MSKRGVIDALNRAVIESTNDGDCSLEMYRAIEDIRNDAILGVYGHGGPKKHSISLDEPFGKREHSR